MTVIDWLLDSDPAIRWQVRRDLLREPEAQVAAERARVATEGWGARLLALQGPDGQWAGTFNQGWTCTLNTLAMLRDMGLDPASAAARTAVARVREHVTWGAEFDDHPFFEGEVEPCINGLTLGLGAYFGAASAALLQRLLGEQLADGGWNCDAPPSRVSSFHSTIRVLEGLLAYETARGPSEAVTRARLRGQEYLLERGLYRRKSTGEVIDPDWARFTFPTRWHYDVLRGLDYLRSAGVRDPRLAEAIALVEAKRDAEGRWPLEPPHPGAVHFELEGAPGDPSRWITLRALRVLGWFRS